MAAISPFRAWRYAGERVPVGQVVTQPYDKITPAMQESYYQASPYNLVRIILGKRLESDTARENVYTRAAGSFQNWRQTGVLKQDPAPCLYRYSQTFAVPGTKSRAERRGFIGLGRIEEYSAGVVFRHEQTLAKPKADRLDLLRATRGHFGQIFMLYSAAGKVDALLDSASRGAAADIEVTDEYDVVHRVWKISDPAVVRAAQEQMRDQKLIIADGHHRYETALAYRNEEARRQAASAGAPAAYDDVMMTFVDMDLPGLVVLPTHRANETKTLVVEKQMPHAPEKIWRALTQPELMAEWLMKNDFQPTVGHKFNFRADPVPNWNGVVDCEVLVVEPNKKLSYSWGSLGVATIVVWTLAATSGGTLVRMEQSGFAPDQKANYQGANYGWQKFIGGLERVVAGLR